MAPTFLIDESVGRSVYKALVQHGEIAETIIDRHGRGALDEVWLPDAGQHRLVAITKDNERATKPQQKALLIQHRVLYFCLAPDHVFTLQEMVDSVVAALPEIKRLVSLPRAARGLIARIHPGGRLTEISLD